jgi:hypothetical protein
MGGSGLMTVSSTRPLLPLSLPDPSTEHKRKHSHTPMVRHCTAPDCGTLGYSYFIRRTLIFTYLSFVLLKHCGEMLQAQIEALEALWEADQQRVEALEA